MTPPVMEHSARRDAMAIISRATRDELARPLGQFWPRLEVRELRMPEAGLVMLRGRIGGDGAPFNLGEATVARAVVEIPGGWRGYGHVLGRDLAKARLAAIADALWQDEAHKAQVESEIIVPVAGRLKAEKAVAAAKTAATKVDFFTLVRGED
jgi:alpha-D-ribose 1-methylphosphonate 5-triphosphate synthase subunit PhnG